MTLTKGDTVHIRYLTSPIMRHIDGEVGTIEEVYDNGFALVRFATALVSQPVSNLKKVEGK